MDRDVDEMVCSDGTQITISSFVTFLSKKCLKMSECQQSAEFKRNYRDDYFVYR